MKICFEFNSVGVRCSGYFLFEFRLAAAIGKGCFNEFFINGLAVISIEFSMSVSLYLFWVINYGNTQFDFFPCPYFGALITVIPKAPSLVRL